MVFTIGVPAVAKLSSEDSHFVTLPVWPVKFNVAPFEPEHTVAAELTVPPTVTGDTVMVLEEELTESQAPFFTTAL